MRVLKVIKIFVGVVVVCFALFGAYKIFKPAPVIDITKDDEDYLKTLGIDVAEGGRASDSGASPLFGNIEGVLPLNSTGTGNTAFQTPPASLGIGASSVGSSAPPFNSSAPPFNSSAPPFNSSAPPFNSSAPPFNSSAPPFNPAVPPSSNPLPSEPNTAPTWDHRQENTNANFPPSGIYPSNSSPQPSLQTSNPPFVAALPVQTVAPSPPYASQQVAPPLNVPVPVAPNYTVPDTAPDTAPVDRQPPPPFQPTDKLPELPAAFPFSATEVPNSTLPNQPVVPASESPKLMSTSVSLLPPIGNQTLTPPTPVMQVDPPPSPPAEAAANLDSQTSTTSSGLPPAFVNTGLRDDSAVINQTDDYQYKPIRPNNSKIQEQETEQVNATLQNGYSETKPIATTDHGVTNSFNPTTLTQTNPEATIISNDPNYFSSAVSVTPLLASTSSPKQANILSSPETAIVETASQQPDFSSNVLSFAYQSSGDKPEIKSEITSEIKSENKSGNTISVKLLPLVIESEDKDVVVESNGRYTQFKNGNANDNVKNIDQEKSTTNSANATETSEGGLSLWSDYLKSVKQNNEAVLAPVREVAGDVSAKVAFAKEEPSGAGNFNPSYGSSSSDIFPVFAESVSADVSSVNLSEQINKANRESPFANTPNPPSGVVATSSSMLIDHAMAGFDKENIDKNNKINNKNEGKTQSIDRDKENGGLSNPVNIGGLERDLSRVGERKSEVKFDGVVPDDSAAVTSMPFVQPPIAPQPVMVTSDLTSGNIFADNKPHEHSPPQSVRDTVSRFVGEQLREYEARDNAKMHVVLVQLSKYYDRLDLNDVERDLVASALDRVALELIYSSKCHSLEPVYKVKLGDTAESIAKQFSISPELLSKINGLNPAEQLTAGRELKVVHGQFDAKVHTKRGELTLLLGGVYAGRFPVNISRNVLSIKGEFVVQSKTITKQTKTLTLNNGIELNGLGRRIGQNALGVSQENIEELFDILTENSVIVIED